MEINPQLVKQLREKTNAGMMDCKRALTESGGDLEKAEAILRTKGIASAGKKASRATKEGIVASYIHLQGKVGVLVEVNCETDFVAKNEIFREFVKDITLHIAAAHPLYVNREEVPEKSIESERAIYEGQVKGKPENVIAKIVEGKLDKFYSTVCLLEQGFIKNPDQTIKELVAIKIAELGENIVIRRFTRYSVGEPLGNDDRSLLRRKASRGGIGAARQVVPRKISAVARSRSFLMPRAVRSRASQGYDASA